jgi:hypothetical protein
MPLPVGKVEIAFTSGYADTIASRTYTNVSTYLVGDAEVSMDYGRADEFPQPDPSRLSFTLDNADGRFTPGKASSPYYPNVKVGKPVRFSTTYSGVDSVRFTGYIEKWELVWPEGADAQSRVLVTATSRRARMGQTAPLESAIRTAYLATSPDAYWTFEDPDTVVDQQDRRVFRDVTNVATPSIRDTQFIGVFSDYPELTPFPLEDGLASPTDEPTMLYFPPFTDPALLGTYPHYVGGGNTVTINTTGELTAEVVGAFEGSVDALSVVTLMDLRTADLTRGMFMYAGSSGISAEMMYRDSASPFSVLDDQYYSSPDPLEVVTTLTDHQIHHFAMTLTGGNVGKFYLDGVLLSTMTLTAPYNFDQPFSAISIGSDTLVLRTWLGHFAVHNRALSDTEILTRANAATAASETILERVERLAAAVGVPAAEVDAETSVAMPVGKQAEAGRSAVEVLDELAASTAGVLYDKRDGTLYLQARNHRYNVTAAFTLGTAAREIEGDLTIPTDNRYLYNSVEITRQGVDEFPLSQIDQASIDAYGVYKTSQTLVSTSQEEALGLASNLLYRYSQPAPRVSRVSVDVSDLSSGQRALVLAADIGTLFNISGLPAQAPTDPLPLFIEGYTETVSPGGHVITFNTTPAPDTAAWVLGTPALSNLGSTTVLVY